MKQNRDSRGRYMRKPKARWRMLLTVVAASFVAGLYVTVPLVQAINEIEPEVIKVEQKKGIEVQIMPVVDWSKPGRVEQAIKETFPDAPIMVEVARCESQFDPVAYNATNDSHDRGLFQISEKYHGVGEEMYDVEKNLQYARKLYDEQGLKPWIWSKHCWSN